MTRLFTIWLFFFFNRHALPPQLYFLVLALSMEWMTLKKMPSVYWMDATRPGHQRVLVLHLKSLPGYQKMEVQLVIWLGTRNDWRSNLVSSISILDTFSDQVKKIFSCFFHLLTVYFFFINLFYLKRIIRNIGIHLLLPPADARTNLSRYGMGNLQCTSYILPRQLWFLWNRQRGHLLSKMGQSTRKLRFCRNIQIPVPYVGRTNKLFSLPSGSMGVQHWRPSFPHRQLHTTNIGWILIVLFPSLYGESRYFLILASHQPRSLELVQEKFGFNRFSSG